MLFDTVDSPSRYFPRIYVVYFNTASLHYYEVNIYLRLAIFKICTYVALNIRKYETSCCDSCIVRNGNSNNIRHERK